MSVRDGLKKTLGTILGYGKHPCSGETFWRNLDYTKEEVFTEIVEYNLDYDKSLPLQWQKYFSMDLTGCSKKLNSRILSKTLKTVKKIDFCTRVKVGIYNLPEKKKIYIWGESPDDRKEEGRKIVRNGLLEYIGSKYLSFKERWRKRFRGLPKSLLTFAAIIQFSFPPAVALNNVIKKDVIYIDGVKKASLLKEYGVNEETTPEEFLCMANHTVHKAVEKQEEGLWRNPVCEDYSRSTRKVYDYMVEEAGREDLVGSTRLMLGEVKAEGSFWGHMWLELKDSEGKKVYFNANSYVPTSESGFEYCMEHSYNPTHWKENYLLGRSTAGGIVLPTAESFIIPGGTGRVYYMLAVNIKDIWEMYDIKWDRLYKWTIEALDGIEYLPTMPMP